MAFQRGKMGMLTVLILILMKGTDGPPVTILPNTGPTVIIINACAGENKQLMTKYELDQEVILDSQWVFSNGNASNDANYVTYCQKDTSGMFMVNPLYNSTVEQCNTTSILLKNISFHDEGYYKLQSLKEKVGKTESLPIFLAVSDTPTKQCKPVIRSHSGNMLNCSTQCEQFDVEWRLKKGGDVVGNGSILLVDCLWKNETILCCLKSNDMECYKGETLDLCAQITPSYCTENKPGENGHDIHADKAPDNPGSNMLGLLALTIIPVLAAVIYVLRRKKIISCTTMCWCTNKPNSSNSVNAEPHADVNDVHVPEETVPMLKNDQEPHADVNYVQVSETPSPILGTVQELDADVKLDRIQEKTFPMLDADDQQVQQQEITSPMLDAGQELDADVQHIQEQDPVHELEEAGTEHQPNSEITREVQELRHAVMCKICFVSRMSVLFMPCNHMATCDNCSSAFEKCPICRAKIEKIENIRYD